MASGKVKAGYETERFLIPSNSNLNDYQIAGFYGVNNAATAASITNSPITTQGYAMIVLAKANQVVQMVIVDTAIYLRQTTSGTFGSWRKVVTEAVS